MSDYSKDEGRALDHNLDMIRKHGTESDKDTLRGSGMSGNRKLSKTLYNNMKKAGDRFK